MKTRLSILIVALASNLTAIAQNATQVLIASGDVWKYSATGVQPPSNWTGAGTYDDAAWPSGTSPLGYSPNNEDLASTTVTAGRTTVYFRRTITIPDVTTFQKFVVEFQRDDGIAIYINGNELVRDSLPKAPNLLSYNTSATGFVPNETEWISKQNTANPLLFLRTGTNVISAEVHQFGTSTDLRFNLKLTGYTGSAGATQLVRGPYLQMASLTAMNIRWRTSTATKGQIRFGELAGSLATIVSEPTSTTEHEIRLTGLTPNTKYYYAVQTAGPPDVVLQGDATNFFFTAPPTGTSKKTRIWALGDFGKYRPGDNRQSRVKNAFLNHVGSNYVDLWLWLGDNAYSDFGIGDGADIEYQNKVFDVYGPDRIMRQTPIYATPGNHDYASTNSLRVSLDIPYYSIVSNPTNAEAGGIPSGTESYYSFDYGTIHFVSLDSDRYEDNADKDANVRFVESKPQMVWLKSDLAAAQSNPAIKWIIAFWHQPPYTKGTHDSDTDKQLQDVRMNLLPVLEQYKVDLVLCGHSHVYERSRLMKGHYGDEMTFDASVHNAVDGSNAKSSGKVDGSANSCFYYKSSKSPTNEGTVYVVTGSGGAGFDAGRTAATGYPHNAMPYSFTEVGMSVYLEIDGNRLDAKAIDENNTIRDQFSIFKDVDDFPVPATDGTTRTAACECTDASGYTHYIDNQANILLSIKKQGNTIGTVGDGQFALTLSGSPGGTVVQANAPTNYVRDNPLSQNRFWRVMNRYWTLKPTVELSGSQQVAIRQYYKNADRFSISSLAANAPDDSLYDSFLGAYKINNENSTYNPNPASGSHVTIPKATAFDTKGAWVYDWNNGGLGSMFGWRHTNMGNGNNSAEYIVGRLNGGGGIGGYYRYLNPMGNQNILLSGGNWEYLANGAAPEANSNWKGLPNGGGFIKTNWVYEDKGGVDLDVESPLGYSPGGVNKEKTRVPACATEPCATVWRTTYFRHTVNFFSFLPFYKYYMLSYKRDGGIVIYINGVERVRENMPGGPVSFTTVPSGPTPDQPYWQTFAFPNDGSIFNVGDNVIAVEVHRTDQSPALYFDMELIRSPDVLTSSNRLAADPGTPLVATEPVVLYPNPANWGRVSFSPSLVYDLLTVSDLLGRVHIQLTEAGTLDDLNVSSLPAGIYLLRSQHGDKISRFKLVKE